MARSRFEQTDRLIPIYPEALFAGVYILSVKNVVDMTNLLESVFLTYFGSAASHPPPQKKRTTF